MTKKQIEQFNNMLAALRTISKYETPDQLKKSHQKTWGCSYEDALEMSYENIQYTAKITVRGIKPVGRAK